MAKKKETEPKETEQTSDEETPAILQEEVMSEETSKKMDEIISGQKTPGETSDETAGATKPEIKAPEAEAIEGEKEEYEDIPQGLVDAGRGSGLSDDEIVTLAEGNMPALKALGKSYEQLVEARRTQSAPKETAKQEAQEQKVEQLKHIEALDLTDIDPVTAGILKKSFEAQNALIDRINRTEQQLGLMSGRIKAGEQQEQDRFDASVDNMFDSVENYPELGKTGSLSTEQQELRKKIHGYANYLTMTESRPYGQILPNVIRTFGAMAGKDIAEQTTMTKIKKRNAMFSARPSGQKTTPKVPESEKEARDEEFEKFTEKWKDLGLS